MDPVLERIEAWERAGLIDTVIAERLRAAEADGGMGAAATAAHPEPGPTPPAPSARRTVSAADILGPAPTVAEMFGYVGSGFLLAAWTAFVGKVALGQSSLIAVGGGLLVAAVVLGAVGLVLRVGDDRRRRAAGIAFLAATAYAAGAAAGVLSSLDVSGPAEPLILALVAVAVASGFRFLHAGLLTQFGLLVSVTTVGGTFLAWLGDLVAPDVFSDKGVPIGAIPDPILMVLVAAATWLLLALGLGLLGLREAAAQRDSQAAPGAPGRRAALIRAWAGTVAVVGLASALTRTDLLASGDYGRVVTPWIADALLLGLAAILVERAFRRDAGSFLFAAGVGLIAALSDFNFSYLSSSSEIGLLIEGGLLLAVGFGANRLRRRLPGGRIDPRSRPDPDALGLGPS